MDTFGVHLEDCRNEVSRASRPTYNYAFNYARTAINTGNVAIHKEFANLSSINRRAARGNNTPSHISPAGRLRFGRRETERDKVFF